MLSKKFRISLEPGKTLLWLWLKDSLSKIKGIEGADSVTLTINEVNTARNSPDRFRLALVSVAGDTASPPVYVSGVDWGIPGFGDTQITKNLQQLQAAGQAPH